MPTDHVPKVFLCHAKPDKDRVRHLYHELKEAGVDPWLDEQNILPGQDWEHEIRNAIRRSDFFLACLSRESVDRRGYFQKEIKLALDVLDELPENQVFLIPVRLEDCVVPDRLRARQWVDLFGWRMRGFSRLLLTFAAHYPSFAQNMSVPIMGEFRAARGDFGEPDDAGAGVKGADWSKLHNLIQTQQWESANDQTFTVLRYVAGPSAASRWYIRDSSEAARISCSVLHRLYAAWSKAGYEPIRNKYPRSVIPRKHEVEVALRPEMEIIAARLGHCGLDSFIWSIRPDGEILLGPVEGWFDPIWMEISHGNSTAIDVLCIISMMSSLSSIPKDVILCAELRRVPDGRGSNPETKSSVAGRIDAAIDVLNDRSFIYERSATQFKTHAFVSRLVLERLDDEIVATSVARVVEAMSILFPDPGSNDWPPKWQLVHHADRAANGYWNDGRLGDFWKKGLESDAGAALLWKLAVHLYTDETKGFGWQRKADGYFQKSAEYLRQRYGDGHPEVTKVERMWHSYAQSARGQDSP